MTDNGSDVDRHCAARGLRHLRTRPYTPRTNGKAERIQSAYGFGPAPTAPAGSGGITGVVPTARACHPSAVSHTSVVSI